MKFPKSFLLLGLLTAGCGAVFVNEGSKVDYLAEGLKDPATSKAKLVVPADQKLIGNFEDGSTRANPKLYGSNGEGSWAAYSFGGNAANSDFVVSGGANGTLKAAHLFGSLVNKGDNSYPSYTLTAKLKSAGLYDASAFSGIRFYYKCPPTDTTLFRRMAIPIAPTMPSSAGGTCSDGCYNNFGYDLGPTADWALKTVAFTDLKRAPGWGSPITPPDFTDHLAEIMDLEWGHNAGNTAGTYKVDMWVDEVELY